MSMIRTVLGAAALLATVSISMRDRQVLAWDGPSGEGKVRMAPQTEYAKGDRRCRVSMRVERRVERAEERLQWFHLAVTVENLGEDDLTLYNPFFHPVHNPLCTDSQTARLVFFDRNGRETLDMLDRWGPGSYGGSYVDGLGQSWVSIRAGASWTGKYSIPWKPDSEVRYAQAIFLDRFVSSNPFGRPPWPIDADFTDPDLIGKVRVAVGDLDDPRVKAWRAAYTGRELFRSNAILLDPKGSARLADGGDATVE